MHPDTGKTHVSNRKKKSVFNSPTPDLLFNWMKRIAAFKWKGKSDQRGPPSADLIYHRGSVNGCSRFIQNRINAFSNFIIGWNLCLNLPYHTCYKGPLYLSRNGGRKDAQKMSGFRLDKIFYLNVDSWQNGPGHLHPSCKSGQLEGDPVGKVTGENNLLCFVSSALNSAEEPGFLRPESGFQGDPAQRLFEGIFYWPQSPTNSFSSPWGNHSLWLSGWK